MFWSFKRYPAKCFAFSKYSWYERKSYSLLTFLAEDFDNDKNIWSTSAAYVNYSIINYQCIPSSEQSLGIISFKPVFGDIPNELSSDQKLPEGIYLRKQGFDRKFIFKYIDRHKEDVRLDTVEVVCCCKTAIEGCWKGNSKWNEYSS